MGKMEKFYEGWVRMTAHPIDNLGVTKDLRFFDHSDKESRFGVRNFVHHNLCAGYVVVTTPMKSEPSEWEWEDARNFPGKPIKEETKPCKVNVIKTFDFEEDRFGNVTISDNFGNSIYLQGDDAVSFLCEIQDAHDVAPRDSDPVEMEQRIMSQYEGVMEAPDSL